MISWTLFLSSSHLLFRHRRIISTHHSYFFPSPLRIRDGREMKDGDDFSFHSSSLHKFCDVGKERESQSDYISLRHACLDNLKEFEHGTERNRKEENSNQQS